MCKIKELKENLVKAIFNNYDAEEHHVANVKIKEVVIERRIGGKRTAIAEILVDYVEGDSAWITRLVEFSEEGGKVKIINMKPEEGVNNVDGIIQEKLEIAVEQYLITRGINKPDFTVKGRIPLIDIREGVEDMTIEVTVGNIPHSVVSKVVIMDGRCIEVLVYNIEKV